ncbi:MAG TPA: flagellar motor protein MotB [Saprospiraceae bacterium]|nr:flagellar motor protein MotB [Saprospiraceae bacterium]
MNRVYLSMLAMAILVLASCVSKKKFTAVQAELASCNEQLGKCGESLNDYMARLKSCEDDRTKAQADLAKATSSNQSMMDDLKTQLADCRSSRDKMLTQVGDLTVVSKGANDNMKQTLAQLAEKDKYIHLLQAAKNKADSLNLALAVNLKSQLKDGIDDQDVDVKIDKTVVMINLSDKMLYQTGSANITSKAGDVLAKIADIVNSKPDLVVMVEGYTDNVPIHTDCVKDNWDLSVKRATAVVRVLQTKYKIDPNRLIAAGRGEYNTLADNGTKDGKAANRRTRIIIMPKLDQFYDLLNPATAPK